MAFSWEKFTAVADSFDAQVTIRTTGQLGFTAGAINRYGIRDYDYVVLYFDHSERAVGLLLTNDQDAMGAIEIKKSDSNTHIRAKNFCDRHEIEYQNRRRRFRLRREPDSEMLYFLLGDAQDDEQHEGEEPSEE